MRSPGIWLLVLVFGSLLGPQTVAADEPTGTATIDFNRDIRPLLADRCFACHGFDAAERQSGLRLDTRNEALKPADSGQAAIVPGKPDESELVRRIFSADPDEQMPPADSNKSLSEAQKELLRRWVAEGAPYAVHWSYAAPQRPAVPQVQNQDWVRNEIDAFVLQRLEAAGLQPSPEADRVTLIRRLTLDLTGLPPTIAEVDEFLADTSPQAYERLVERLLASPRYGERMALDWLDMARYADTHGYHIDSHRDMWRWREWVINAYNSNLPFDQFTIQQLAGDLLPNATVEQKIATGFNRNHMINFEGGAIPEEYLVAYIVDRINTTSTVWMGLTMGCAQCHDHKYDPITMRDFYGLYAFFNNVPEQGLDGQAGNAAPFMKAPTANQARQLDAYKTTLAELQARRDARAVEAAADQLRWEQQMIAALQDAPPEPAGLAAHFQLDEMQGEQVRDAAGSQTVATVRGNFAWEQGKFNGALQFDGSSYVDWQSAAFERDQKFSFGAWVFPATKDHMAIVSQMDDAAGFRGWDLYLGGGQIFVHIVSQWDGNAIRINSKQSFEPNQWYHIFATYDGSSTAAGVRLYVNGRPVEVDITHDKLTDSIRTDKPAHIGRRNPGAAFRGRIDEVRIYSRDLTPEEVAQLAGSDPIRPILAIPAEQRTPEQQEQLRKHYLSTTDEPYKALTAQMAEVERQQTELTNLIPTTMVMQELDQPRETFMLIRGEYNRPGEKVTPSVPASLTPLPAGAPANRLGLAQWLVDPGHPLTARVAVNRYWQMYFGSGLVKTSENFGTQGELPSHPELLDWLATEFIRSNWDVKAMQRLIVTSSTYRQSSRVTPELLERDPENRLLARGPRVRLTAEFIRDGALAVSGLLNGTIGGPSVKPYQPPGLWDELAFGGNFSAQTYVQDHGAAIYRRSMYIFWKRTCPPPSLQAFDAPEREFCMVRRSTTNTPLQALVLMNDPTYVEAARHFAERLMAHSSSPEERLRYGFRLVVARLPSETELNVLTGALNQQLEGFRRDPEAATRLLKVGESQRNEQLDTAELAAWTTIASILLNLDEAVTKN